MSKVNFVGGTQALFDAVTPKDTNTLYFISDTQRIYKGDIDFTQNVIPVANFPDAGVENKIYIHRNTLETRVFVDGEWKVVLPGYVQTIEDLQDAANGGKLATIDAIKAYIDTVLTARVEAIFQDAQFDNETGDIQFYGTDEEEMVKAVKLEGVAHDASFDADNLKITIPQYGKEDLVINIPKDQFLKDAYYAAEYTFEDGTKGPAIVFVVETAGETTKEIAVPAEAMTNDYRATSTNSIQITIDDEHNIQAQIKVQPNTERGYADGFLTVYNQNRGMIYNTGVKVDNNTDADMEESNTVIPTGAVVAAAIRKAVEALGAQLLDHGNAGEVVISTEDGIVRSGVVIGGAELSANPNAQTLATEAAVMDAISWKTLA